MSSGVPWKRRLWPYVLVAIVLSISAAAIWRLTADGVALDVREMREQWGFLLRLDEPVVVGGSFTDQDQQTWTVADLKDNWTYLYFGYTHCPDICAPTLAKMQRLSERTEAYTKERPDEVPVQFVMVSVDPGRDSPARLKNFMAAVSPSVTGLNAPVDEVYAFAKQMRADFTKPEDIAVKTGTQKQLYEVGHSGEVFLIDPNGKNRGSFAQPQNVSSMFAVLLRLNQLQD